MRADSSTLELIDNSLDYIVKNNIEEVSPYSDARFSEEKELKKYNSVLEKKSGRKNFEVKNLLEDMCDMNLAVERKALELNAELLREQLIRHNYDRFSSVDFLSQSVMKDCVIPHRYEKRDTRVKLWLPKWGVFGIDSNENYVSFFAGSPFSLSYGEDRTLRSEDAFVEYGHGFKGPEILRNSLAKSLDANLTGLEGNNQGAYFNHKISNKLVRVDNLNINELERFGLNKVSNHEEYSFTTELNVEIPNKSRSDIQKARKLFGDDNVFFIAERRPEDWEYASNIPIFDVDPIVVGCNGKDDVFLVAKFDSTFEEARVVRDNVDSKKQDN